MQKALGPLAVAAPPTAPATAKTKKALDPLTVAEQYILTAFG